MGGVTPSIPPGKQLCYVTLKKQHFIAPTTFWGEEQRFMDLQPSKLRPFFTRTYPPGLHHSNLSLPLVRQNSRNVKAYEPRGKTL